MTRFDDELVHHEADEGDISPAPSRRTPGSSSTAAAVYASHSGGLARSVQMLAENVARLANPGAAAAAPRTAGEEGAYVKERAAEGIEGGGAPIPFQQQIQAAFGGHDVSGVKAHVGGAAATAGAAIGAKAYATGDHVAFREAPDLHTAAHEAAHVVQQRGGVQLKAGVGEVGDTYERQADEVADAVVRGDSAETILGAPTSASPSPGSTQRKAVQLRATSARPARAGSHGSVSDVQRMSVQRSGCDNDLPPRSVARELVDVRQRIDINIESWRSNLEQATDSAVDGVFKAKEQILAFKHGAAKFIMAAAALDISKIVKLDEGTFGAAPAAGAALEASVAGVGKLNVGTLVTSGVSAMANAAMKMQVTELASAKKTLKEGARSELLPYVSNWKQGAHEWARRQLEAQKVTPQTTEDPVVCEEKTVALEAEVGNVFPPLADAGQLSDVRQRAQQIVWEAQFQGPVPDDMKSGATKSIEGQQERRADHRATKGEDPGPSKLAPIR